MTRVSSPASYLDARRLNGRSKDGKLLSGHREIRLVAGPPQYYGSLPVNTSCSVVMIPDAVDAEDPAVQSAIAWSELLEPLLINNYESDPALSWQYFGSSEGFVRTAWYVESATSPRDVVILMDASGSMSGQKRSLASATASAILDTLGANDFVNVFRFSESTQELVPCFKDSLVQANAENVRELKAALDSIRPENIANFTSALVTAFELLHKYNRSGLGSQCNQAIMLITDGSPAEYSDVFRQYNWPHMPVRYFSRVGSIADAREAALNHVEVLARPLVLYQNHHPLHWSPSFVDMKTRTARLLGVVGTDVPIREIQKLVPPYKPPSPGSPLTPQFGSVDLALLELAEGEHGGPYENHSLLNDLRHDMIDQKEGEAELTVIVHHDGMKRASSRRQKYFYHGIEGTPFSLGIAMPDGYGLHEVIAEEEIKLSISRVNVTDYFKGHNWKVHPDWVYCEYNYVAEHPFSSPEEQMLHFLERTLRPGWKWMSMRPRSPLKDRPEPGDKSLFQSLVFDAKITEGLIGRAPSLSSGNNHQAYKMFGVAMTFVATRSGLLRWQYHGDMGQDPSLQQFSGTNKRAIDEVWYRRAVEQYAIEPESFVFTVDGDSEHGSSLVTASHAVFVDHRGHRAPAAVVGLQFKQTVLAAHFINITSTCLGQLGCRKTCASDELDCYVLDNNGFVILSEKPDHAGKFFGQLDGTIMDSLVQDRIFKKVAMHDFQGACHDDRSYWADSAPSLKPILQHVGWIAQWTGAKIAWLMSTILQPTFSFPMSEEEEEDDYEQSMEEREDEDGSSLTDWPPTAPPTVLSAPPTRHASTSVPLSGPARPCEKRVDLYALQADRLNTSGAFNPLKGKLTNCHVTGCERPFSVQKIPKNTLCPCGSKSLSITPQEVMHSSTCPTPKDSLYRRRPTKCVSYHPEESEIHVCGAAGGLLPHFIITAWFAGWIVLRTFNGHTLS
ncbi:hypothetical protein B566_EDAN012706 [Ephemera danica]|nr:hypothetical protein B566_EDAN012706 [Ephemera danica]